MGLTTVEKERIAKNVIEVFLELFRREVTAVTIENPMTHFPEEVVIKKYASRYNDIMLESKDNYPVLIVNKPNLSHEQLTFRNTNTIGYIPIEIHCTNSLATDKFYDQINNIIDTHRDDLETAGITNLILDNDDNDTYTRGGFKDHWAQATWKFEFDFVNGD